MKGARFAHSFKITKDNMRISAAKAEKNRAVTFQYQCLNLISMSVYVEVTL